MKSKIVNNILWKLISIVCASLLWLVVLNIQNPEETIIVKNIEVKPINTEVIDENDLLITDKGVEFVSVKLRGKRLLLEKLKRNENLNAYINMRYYTKIGPDNPNPMQIKIEIPEEYKDYIRIEEQEPEYAQVIIEENKEQSKKIELALKNSVKEGYEIVRDEIRLSPSEIKVDGTATIINSIDSVKAVVDINNATKSINETVLIKFYNEAGEEITDIKTDTLTTNVYIPILKKKTLTYHIQTINNLPQDLRLEDISLSPRELVVLGDESLINSINSSVSIPVDLSDIREDKAIKYEVKLPKDVINTQGINFITINIDISRK